MTYAVYNKTDSSNLDESMIIGVGETLEEAELNAKSAMGGYPVGTFNPVCLPCSQQIYDLVLETGDRYSWRIVDGIIVS